MGRRYCPRAGPGQLGGGAAWGVPGTGLQWAQEQLCRASEPPASRTLSTSGPLVSSVGVELNDHGAGWAPKTGLPGKY